MGHRKKHAPKRGSLAYLPRKRAARPIGRIRHWPEYVEEPIILGFAGYKAGMTHVVIIDNDPNSPFYGHEIAKPVTVIDAPPLVACAIRAYEQTPYGLRTVGEAWINNLNKDLSRVFPIPKNYDTDKALEKLEENLDKIDELRLVVHTQPRMASGVPKKKPDVMEYKIGGKTIEEQFEYAKSILGNEIRVRDVLREGSFVDVIAVTKGKGFQGVIARWGVRRKQHKSRKTVREVAAIGSWHPARVRYTVPRAGQMGYHQRTEYNKLVLKIGENGQEITPLGGFPRYGIIRGDYVLLLGSCPGTVKRLIRLRYAIRPPKEVVKELPQIIYISTSSKQGK